MRIFQITDPHIVSIGRETINNIDVWGKFKVVLAKAKENKPDLLVISGDLCYAHGEQKIYRRIKQELETTGLNYLVIAGNHDDATMMANVFGLPLNNETGECYYAKEYDEGRMLFLDSVKKTFSEQQWAWFTTQISKGDPMLIFTHHPPCIAGSPFMDKNHCFLEAEKFRAISLKSKKPLNVFCGHYHQERTINMPNMTVFVTPSTMVQINIFQEEYTLAQEQAGYRVINWDGIAVQTSVLYVE